MERLHLFDRAKAAQSRHRHIHQHDIGLDTLSQFHGLLTVPRFADDLYIVGAFQQGLQCLASKLMVIGNEYSDHHIPFVVGIPLHSITDYTIIYVAG